MKNKMTVAVKAKAKQVWNNPWLNIGMATVGAAAAAKVLFDCGCTITASEIELQKRSAAKKAAKQAAEEAEAEME